MKKSESQPINLKASQMIDCKKSTSKRKKSKVCSFLKFFIICGIMAFSAIQISTAIIYVKDYTLEKYATIRTSFLIQVNDKISEELQPVDFSESSDSEELGLDLLIEKVSQDNGIKPIVLKALVAKESSHGNMNSLYRFEQHVFNSRSKVDSKFSESERRMLASSHGITQIMGYRAEPDCGVHWSKLYDNYIALNCATKILKENLERAKSKYSSPGRQLQEAFRIYNGSGPRAEQYASDVMSNIGSILFDELV